MLSGPARQGRLVQQRAWAPGLPCGGQAGWGLPALGAGVAGHLTVKL